MIEVAQLTKTYGTGPTAVRALGGVDMAVPDGEFVAIMGPSGSGKSTLLHILGALEAPSGGTVAVAGRPHRRAPRPPLRGSRRRRADPHPPRAHRLRLSVLQPAALADRGRERAAARAHRRPARRGP